MPRYLFLLLLAMYSHVALAQNSEADSLIAVINTAKEDSQKVNNLRDLSTLYGENNDIVNATRYGYQGIQLSRKIDFKKGTALGYLRLGYVNGLRGDFTTARIFYDTAVALSREVKNDNLSALVYLNRGDAYAQLHNAEKALKDCDTSLRFAEKANNNDRRARVFQTMGTIHLLQDDFDNCIVNTRKAVAIYLELKNMPMFTKAMNNIGLAYKYKHDYLNAIKSFKEALVVADTLDDPYLLSLVNSNLSMVYVQNKQFREAMPYAARAHKLAIELGDSSQLWMTYGTNAEINMGLKNYHGAIEDGLKAYGVAEALGNLSNLNNTSDLLAEAYSQTGNYEKAFEYMRTSKGIQDSLSKMEYSEQIAGLQTSLNVAQKDNEINILNKDKQLHKQQLRQQQLITVGSLLGIILTVFALLLLVNRYRIKQRLKVLELRNKIAADLHDEVGSSMSSIRMLSEIAGNQQTDNEFLNTLLSKISNNAYETVEKMSDIVWMVRPDYDDTGNMLQRMRRFMEELCEPLGISHHLSTGDIERVKLSMPQRKNLYLIFKEAINNAAKYSESTIIEAAIVIKDRMLTLNIKDNGKGFDEEKINAGNGLNNMRQRAKELGGDLLLQSLAGDGTHIQLSFRLSE